MMVIWLMLMACNGPDDGDTDTDTNTTDTVTDTNTDTTTTDTTPVVPDDIPDTLVISEVQTRNESTHVNVADQTFCDWIELFNGGTEEVDLSRLSVGDGSDKTWVGTGTLGAGEFLVLYGTGVKPGDELNPGPYEHELPFNLDGDGEELTLMWDGFQFAEEEVPELKSDMSYARIPDGGPDMVVTAIPTPGLLNGELVSETLVSADETWFVKELMHEIDFELTTQAYNTMNTRSEKEVPASITVDGDAYLTRVGFRLKGSASFALMDAKPAFKVDLNQYTPGYRMRGLKAFNLHNGNVWDPTRIRDHISYKLAREAGLMAPRVGWAHVTVNGNDYGVYMIIEQHDDEMIQYNYPGDEDDSYLFEPNETQGGGWGGDFGTGGSLSFDIEEGPLPMPPEKVSVLDAADALFSLNNPTDEQVEELWTYVEKDNLLSYLAWETVVMHTDGYRGPNNWRLMLKHSTNKLEWVPAGAEWTWSTPVDVFPNWANAAAYKFCLNNQGCKREYAERVLEVADMLDDLDLATEFETLSTWIDPWTDADPRSNHSANQVNNERTSTLLRLNQNADDARSQVYSEFPALQP